MISPEQQFAGLLLGTAVGDALGLPREGLAPTRAAKLFGDPPLEHRLIFGRGMISDDTEHACMTAQALLASHGDSAAFARSLAWRLRGWLLSVPAGVGLATLRAILKLWCGVSPARSGVWSAGNGPAMRAPIIGLWSAAQKLSVSAMHTLVDASTIVTHRDPRAVEGARILAHAARRIVEAPALSTKDMAAELQSLAQGAELRKHLELVIQALAENRSPDSFAREMTAKPGISGYINHTVPAALFCWLHSRNDFRRAVEAAVMLGGDTDSVAAITGALVGCDLGPDSIPPTWLSRLAERPRSSNWMRHLAQQLAQSATNRNQSTQPLPLFWPALIIRNPLFAGIVLCHGLRRVLPPY